MLSRNSSSEPVTAIGDQRIMGGLLKQLSAQAFKDRKVNIRVTGAAGGVTVKTLAGGFASA